MIYSMLSGIAHGIVCKVSLKHKDLPVLGEDDEIVDDGPVV